MNAKILALWLNPVLVREFSKIKQECILYDKVFSWTKSNDSVMAVGNFISLFSSWTRSRLGEKKR